MMLGLAGVLALQENTEEAIAFIERGIPLSANEKQKATMRAVLCFLYLKCDRAKDARRLAATLPHMRESREIIQPLIEAGLAKEEMDEKVKLLLLGGDV